MVAKRIDADSNKPRRPPAATPEVRELELQSLAYDLAERRLRDGSASAQEITYWLKASSRKEQLELKQLEQDTLLKAARVEQIAATAGQAELLKAAMAAFTEYRGQDVFDED